MKMYTVYEHPTDFPEHYVVRVLTIVPRRVVIDPIGCLCDTLAEARTQIPWGMVNVGRDPTDDPAIKETWV